MTAIQFRSTLLFLLIFLISAVLQATGRPPGRQVDSADTQTSSLVFESTKCQTEAREARQPGSGLDIPECTENGDYEPKQCSGNSGICWCVNQNGEELPGTRHGRGGVTCNGIGSAIPLQGKPTSQSSTHDPSRSTSDKAVDGDTNGDYFSDSCTHTSSTETGNPWWVVDIEETYCVGRVVIYNRVDCCGDRLDGAIIRVGSNSVHTNNPECASRVSSTEDTRVIEIECNLSGQYLSVELTQNVQLQLCEVEAYTGHTCRGSAIPLQGKPTSQSSTHDPTRSTSDKAVDGDTNGDYFSDSCTHTSSTEIGNPWWRVDMEDTYCVGKVVIYNRVDCCGDRLDGAIVRVGSDSVYTNNPECASRVSSTEDTQ
ncbi:uncharacterized protein [Amphiura filiformis]|uniref:uncharacterized protein isoform X2 n=1 Tax=Amphiura filiformis TaxID=82378 RepID=UPI003B211D19